uniref:Uncharacterized protein n=1 Tax=Setaria italica TaxID=4555 RepID=K4AHJ7_SETIT
MAVVCVIQWFEELVVVCGPFNPWDEYVATSHFVLSSPATKYSPRTSGTTLFLTKYACKKCQPPLSLSILTVIFCT